MDIKDQVCSLGLSKRLKELGYPQESLWWHWQQYSDKKWIVCQKSKGCSTDNIISAPSVAEIGMELPYRIKQRWFFRIEKCSHFWRVSYMHNDGEYYVSKKLELENANITANTEANARGLMWEYLKKNGLIKEKNDV